VRTFQSIFQRNNFLFAADDVRKMVEINIYNYLVVIGSALDCHTMLGMNQQAKIDAAKLHRLALERLALQPDNKV
jgi:hypothetical protein